MKISQWLPKSWNIWNSHQLSLPEKSFKTNSCYMHFCHYCTDHNDDYSNHVHCNKITKPLYTQWNSTATALLDRELSQITRLTAHAWRICCFSSFIRTDAPKLHAFWRFLAFSSNMSMISQKTMIQQDMCISVIKCPILRTHGMSWHHVSNPFCHSLTALTTWNTKIKIILLNMIINSK